MTSVAVACAAGEGVIGDVRKEELAYGGTGVVGPCGGPGVVGADRTTRGGDEAPVCIDVVALI